MINLETTYLGLKLKNPVIVSSCGLTNSFEKVRKLEDLGAGAVVLKSLFEEQIKYEAGSMANGSDDYPEAADYLNYYTKSNSIDTYLSLIEDCKKVAKIPIVASINCTSASEWVSFAKDIEKAGADAIELNVYYIPVDKDKSGDYYENIYFEILSKVKDIVKIPISVKLGNHFNNLLNMVDQLYKRGTGGVTLFNRFYEPDIDIKNLKVTAAEVLSSPADIRNSLRWVAILAGQNIKVDIAASTGIHDGAGVVKQLLAGATVTKVCSTLYKNGIEHLTTIVTDLEKWMKEHNFKSINEFRGRMSYKKIEDPSLYERSQFMRYFSSVV